MQMKYHTLVSRAREHDREVLDLVSGGVSLAYIAYGVCNPPKTTPLRGGEPQFERNRTHVILPTFTHSFHLTLFTPVAPKTSAASPTNSDPVPFFYLSRASISSSTSAVPLLFSPQKECPFRHGRGSDSRGQPRGDHTDFCQWVNPPGVLLPANLTPF